ncbi:glycosyltransferase family 1 protein [uncultured Pseudokineococcus sp.]|uniref:glycosyltransferase family 4 protein n=1 Tax=uncultured Pseudokineococcus sp. TaxID=1642928 RepID=UPI002630C115|nr:glycosyltransferase family 1 protein [uncultured Pseudokineococcus sp.]
MTRRAARSAPSVAVNARFLLPGDQLEGLGRFTDETLKRMVRDHPDVTFHLLHDRRADPRYRYGPNVVQHVLPPPARHPVLWAAWFEGAVAAWLLAHRPAVLLSPDGFTTLATRVPRVTVVHDLAFEHFPEDVTPLVGAYYRRMTPRYVRASSRVVAVSRATRDDVVSTYGTDPEDIAVVPNAVDARFAPVGEGEAAELRARWAQDHPYLLFVGALQPRKNLVTLLRAFDRFRDETGSQTRLVVAGRSAWKAGPTLEAYEAMAHRDAVLLPGRVPDEDLPGLYAGARATVFIPHFEGFGLPVLEAQASGSPVLTSDRSSMPEVAGDGALLVDPLDVAAVAGCLARLDSEPDLRQDLVRRGSANAQRYSWDRSARLLWDELVRASGGRLPAS